MTEDEIKLKKFLMDYATLQEMDIIYDKLSNDDFDGADKVIAQILERITK